MIVIDSHMHSRFSFDSTAEPQEMIESAVQKGIQCIAFTEHLDIDEYNKNTDFSSNFQAYFEHINRLRAAYGNKIDIIIGMEAGFGDYNDIISDLTQRFPFEYIINSIHVHNGIDYFMDQTYLKHSKYDFFEEYLCLVLESLSAPYRFDAIGHLGYPLRVAKYEDNSLSYQQHSQTIDKILKKAIADQIIIEVNTSVYRSVHPFLPSEEILARYRELGGQYITFSSDAHSCGSLGRNYEATIARLKKLGFCHLTKSKNGKKELLPI